MSAKLNQQQYQLKRGSVELPRSVANRYSRPRAYNVGSDESCVLSPGGVNGAGMFGVYPNETFPFVPLWLYRAFGRNRCNGYYATWIENSGLDPQWFAAEGPFVVFIYDKNTLGSDGWMAVLGCLFFAAIMLFEPFFVSAPQPQTARGVTAQIIFGSLCLYGGSVVPLMHLGLIGDVTMAIVASVWLIGVLLTTIVVFLLVVIGMPYALYVGIPFWLDNPSIAFTHISLITIIGFLMYLVVKVWDMEKVPNNLLVIGRNTVLIDAKCTNLLQSSATIEVRLEEIHATVVLLEEKLSKNDVVRL